MDRDREMLCLGSWGGAGTGVWCVGLQRSRQNWPDGVRCCQKVMERWIGTMDTSTSCASRVSPLFLVRATVTGMQKSWGLTSSNSYHRANCWCFSPLICLYVHFRGQKGGPVNPASCKYSSPSKVNAPAEPVGQEKTGGGGDAGL